MFNKDFFKITAFYAAGVVTFFYVFWTLLEIALPGAKLDIVQALAGAFGINMPDSFSVEVDGGEQAAILVGLIVVMSLGLIVLNVFFSAVITARLIQPRVALITSSRGALSTAWNSEHPYVLVRLSNFHKADLIDVTLQVVLTVEELRDNNGHDEHFRTYLPVEHFTPKSILFMEPRMPWTIAVPADARLSNSLTKDYHFKPGEPVAHSFSAGKKIKSVERSLQILIRGTDTSSYSQFVIHRKISIDSQVGDAYAMHLHRGSFKSLPLRISDKGDLELFAA